jgi:hypothetical protein
VWQKLSPSSCDSFAENDAERAASSLWNADDVGAKGTGGLICKKGPDAREWLRRLRSRERDRN